MNFSQGKSKSRAIKVPVPFVVCVEGNIGSGKSTLLANLKQAGFNVISEPIDTIWGRYLPRLYEDLKRWGFCFQMEVMDWFRQLSCHNFSTAAYFNENSNCNDTENIDEENYNDEHEMNKENIVPISDRIEEKEKEYESYNQLHDNKNYNEKKNITHNYTGKKCSFCL